MSLDYYVRTGLNQDRPDSESDDGCDAAVLRIDRDEKAIEFAGAKLGLFQVSVSGVLTRHQGSRCSLGYQDVVVEADKPVVKKISYQSGDVFAVVTDGFTDQIGGSTGKSSFGYRRLEDILKANYKASAEEITVAMRNEFAAWQGTNARRDDVTALVFRL
jgi:serine/threonine protein phosphatase PrpC